jgi:hypothetical protein
MPGLRNLRAAVIVAGAILLIGCAGGQLASTGGGGGTTVSTPPPPLPPTSAAPSPPLPPRITYPSIFVTDYDTTPNSVVVLQEPLSSLPTTVWRFPGYLPAVDGAGNIYVLSCYLGSANCTSPSINVYSPDPFQIVRSLPVGPGTKIPRVYGMTVSAAGDIFVSDGNGIAVFGPTADGNADPVRRIVSTVGTPLTGYYGPSMSVDGSGNLYIDVSGGIAVFGPTDNGTIAPSRLIHVQTGTLTTDSQGNLYVLCHIKRNDGLNPYGVYEYAATANGDAVPLRYITSADLNAGFYNGEGVAVDAAGLIYISATVPSGAGGVWEFPADASGSVTPSKLLTWDGENNGGIAVH